VIGTRAGQADIEQLAVPPVDIHPRSKEIDMNRNLASTLAFAGTAAAAFALAAMTTAAYADDITIDSTPFVSTKTRAEVRAEVMGQADQLRMAHGEGAPEMNRSTFRSSLTRAQVTDAYIASRDEVNAFNGEDSGSSYLAANQTRSSVLLAGKER
jgi:hypothetical protein